MNLVVAECGVRPKRMLFSAWGQGYENDGSRCGCGLIGKYIVQSVRTAVPRNRTGFQLYIDLENFVKLSMRT
jgi:hypothetical protein